MLTKVGFYYAFVVQWIEQLRPKELMLVRFRPKAQNKLLVPLDTMC